MSIPALDAGADSTDEDEVYEQDSDGVSLLWKKKSTFLYTVLNK
jgi:hypothetical protein